jgi:hypothetical protein
MVTTFPKNKSWSKEIHCFTKSLNIQRRIHWRGLSEIDGRAIPKKTIVFLSQPNIALTFTIFGWVWRPISLVGHNRAPSLDSRDWARNIIWRGEIEQNFAWRGLNRKIYKNWRINLHIFYKVFQQKNYHRRTVAPAGTPSFVPVDNIKIA